jgi:hypothetical protein
MATRAEQIERMVDGLTAVGFTVINNYDPGDRPVTLVVTDGRVRGGCRPSTPGRARSSAAVTLPSSRSYFGASPDRLLRELTG